MRLIDADDVMEMLTNIELSCTVTPITEAKLALRDIPTAYDVDKVVEQLEEAERLAYKRYIDCPVSNPCHVRYQAQYMERERCLEIVKAGRINNVG